MGKIYFNDADWEYTFPRSFSAPHGSRGLYSHGCASKHEKEWLTGLLIVTLTDRLWPEAALRDRLLSANSGHPSRWLTTAQTGGS